ncbi:acyltransferase family protein [Stackebrandtia nassauensis]|uniref:Acyltransferase 3 n=1 Tax=Stackebrandtia nassauensis (strain DSM 44728 / CIP 108903 / NRRL B-16338 / NBRC 102104 / LLR-40K-21) TaxID=446470 RepID=D3QAB9_STANL|nr:acyltransferase [Stackebrandtia nassauensis]ADD42702.1 acyltransferase 3 [Stackebrandtia nassauensis DSM 44728]
MKTIRPGAVDDAGGSVATSQRLEVHGYRALAAVSVMTFHAYQNNWRAPDWKWPLEGTIWHEVMLATDLCVDLFFVLSGLLLGLQYAKSCLGEAAPRSGRALLLRRATRLIPLYYIVVCTVWAITNPDLPGNWRDLVLHLTFTHVYSQEYIFYTDGPAWSLANEMHYYLLLALLGALAQKCCQRLRTRGAKLTLLIGGTLTLIGASVVYKLAAAYVYHVPADHWPTWFGPLAKLDVFAVGLLISIFYAAGLRFRHGLTQILVLLSGMAILAAGLYLRPAQGVEPLLHPAFAAGCGLLIASTAMGTTIRPRWLKWRPLVSVSMASYSLYLWHEPIMRYLRYIGALPDHRHPLAFPITAIMVFCAAVPVAIISYKLIEMTGQKLMAAFDSRGRPRDYYADALAESPSPSPSLPTQRAPAAGRHTRRFGPDRVTSSNFVDKT